MRGTFVTEEALEERPPVVGFRSRLTATPFGQVHAYKYIHVHM